MQGAQWFSEAPSVTPVTGVTYVVFASTVPKIDPDRARCTGRGPLRPRSATLSGVNDMPDPDAWLTLPDLAERLGVRITDVRRMIEEGHLVAVRRGERNVLSVPEAFVGEDGPLPELRGTFTVLKDGGFSDEEIVAWMFAPDERLVGGSPIGAIRGGAKTEVRRRAMEEAL